ncbi:MAG: Gfo/Idh/MocA family oxidoreductase [Pseudomonadota bacterium]
MTIRIAVIGAGIMGADHARIIAEDLPGVTLQVVCDISEEQARRLADECGAVDSGTDAISTITRKDVDAIVIASTDETHAELTIAAISAGKPVLCEKPLAPTAKDCLQIVDVESRLGQPLVQLGFMRRFDRSYREMRQTLSEGVMGRPLMMHNFHRNVISPGTWFTSDMAITNSASHEFDIARHVLGCEYTSISVSTPRRSDDQAVPVMMVLETSDGQLVNIEVNNNAAYGYDVRGELVCEKGSVHLTTDTAARYDLDYQSSQPYPADWRPRFAEAYRRQNKAWIDAINTGRPSKIAANSWDGYCAAIVAEAGVRSLRKGARVAVEMEEEPAFYRLLKEAA